MSVLATPISACWTASKDEDTSSTGPTNAPIASKRIICGFSRKDVNVAPALLSSPTQAQIKMTAASIRIAFARKGDKSPTIPCFERTSPTAWPSPANARTMPVIGRNYFKDKILFCPKYLISILGSSAGLSSDILHSLHRISFSGSVLRTG